MFKLSAPKRISNIIILVVLSLEFVSMGIWGMLTYYSSEHELSNTINDKLIESAIRTSSEIGKFFDPLDSQIIATANLISALSINETEYKDILKLLLISNPEIEEISVINAQSIEEMRVSRMKGYGKKDLRNLRSNSLLLKANNIRNYKAGYRYSSEIYFSKYSEPQISILYPFNEGKYFYLLKVNLKWLWDKVQDQKIGDSGYVYVLNNNLDLIAHNDPSYVLSGLNIIDSHVSQDLFTFKGEHSLEIYQNFKQQQVAGISHYNKAHNWWIVVEQSTKEAFASLNRIINQFIIEFLLVAIVSIFVMTFFLRRIMKPLEELEKGFSKVANGDRNITIEISGNNEISSLASSFNTMTLKLDKHIKSLLETQNNLEQSRKDHESSEQRILSLLNSTSEAIYGINMDGICTFCNPSTMLLLNYKDTDQVVDQTISNIIEFKAVRDDSSDEIIKRIHMPDLLGKGIHLEDVLIIQHNGTSIHAEVRSYPVYENSELTGAVVTLTDISERYSYQQVLKHQAYHDSLTGLPNRSLLHEHLDKFLSTSNNQLAFMIIDLDRFKEINDSLGHHSGDILLKMIGPRLQVILGEDDVLARLGGDEFAILLKTYYLVDDVVKVAKSLLTAITEPFNLEGMQIQIDASIGIAISPLHSDDGSTLMRYADVAMYHAKTNKLGYSVYNRELDSHSPRRLALFGEIRQAIDSNHFTLYYQPKIKISDKSIVGFEALLRWNHPEYGLLTPDDFIPLAELGEIINPLTFWVINQAITDRQKWCAQDWHFDVAVNVSVRNIQDINIIDKINELIETNGMQHKHLELELTESAIMTDPVRAQETLQKINDLGIRISIDDYGTGYSSLAYLKKLPIDKLKIDKSFVFEMINNDNDALIVRSTIKLAHNLNLKVIAEGVEDQDSLDLLEIIGCDYAQGYYISKPIPADDIISWCEDWNKNNNAPP